MSDPRWVQKVRVKKGALHRQLGITGKIPLSLLRRLDSKEIGEMYTYKKKRRRMTRLLKRRVSLAITFRKMKRR